MVGKLGDVEHAVGADCDHRRTLDIRPPDPVGERAGQTVGRQCIERA
jgi:hypothetical protein